MKVSKTGKSGISQSKLECMLELFPSITVKEADNLFKAYKDIESGKMNDINARGYEIENEK